MHTEQLQKRWGSTGHIRFKMWRTARGGKESWNVEKVLRAKKLVTKGKLAEMITLTSAVAADDTANMGVRERMSDSETHGHKVLGMVHSDERRCG